MGSKQTQLVFANLRNVKIKKIQTSVQSNSDWDGNDRPDHTFTNISLDAFDSLSRRLELNDPAIGSLKNGTFTTKVHYEDNKSIEFTCNQKYAIDTDHAPDRRILKTENGLEVCQTFGAGTNSLELRDVQMPDNSTWMANLLKVKPEIKLNELTMPGSHDSGMYVGNDCSLCDSSWTVTQTDSFLKQLKGGVRYFDVRVCKANNEYFTYHGEDHTFTNVYVGCNGGRLSEIINDANTFLAKDGKGETIFFEISHTYKNVNKFELINYFLAECKNVFKTKKSENYSTLKLSETSGNIVLLFDNSEFSSFIDPSRGIIPSRSHNNIEYGFKVYDQYSDKSELAPMRDDQLKKLLEFGGYGHQYLHLLAWTLTANTTSVKNISILSSRCRAYLPESLAKIRRGELKKTNIVDLDYTDPWYSSLIIDLNK